MYAYMVDALIVVGPKGLTDGQQMMMLERGFFGGMVI